MQKNAKNTKIVILEKYFSSQFSAPHNFCNIDRQKPPFLPLDSSRWTLSIGEKRGFQR